MEGNTMPRLSRLSRSIQDRVALVTGAASGMGRATAHLFADEGAVVAVTDLQESAVQRVVEEIEKAGGRARGWELDVSDPDRIRQVVGEIAEEFGGIDIVVNNAGVSIPAPLLLDGYETSWARTLDVNLSAHMRVIRAALPHLERSDGGRVVNIASTEGVGAQPYVSAYTASKHGVIGFTRGLAVECAKDGVTFNCVCPGPIHTGMTEPIPDTAKEKFARRRVPLRRYGNPEEVAHATLSLVLPAASYINGAVLMVDGGLSIQNN
jgi:3-oxoacyl-[acyl-carrier protein] reductase